MSGSRDFGKIINERRLSLGYSLGQLANRMGTTATKVRSWERGDAVPDDATLDQLAEELNMTIGVLRATLPESEPTIDDPDEDATAAVAGLVFSNAADTAAAEVEDEGEAEPTPEPEDADTDAEDESGDDAELPEPTAVVAAVGKDAEDADATDDVDADEAGGDDDGEEPQGDADDDMRLGDLPTEAVPVVPVAAAAVPVAGLEASGGLVAAPVAVATAPSPTRLDPNDLGVPEPSGFFAPVEQFMATVFDPDKNYLVWIRLVLILIFFFIFLRVLAWAVPEFFDVLEELLDTIESTPTEVDPATGFIEG